MIGFNLIYHLCNFSRDSFNLVVLTVMFVCAIILIEGDYLKIDQPAGGDNNGLEQGDGPNVNNPMPGNNIQNNPNGDVGSNTEEGGGDASTNN